MKLYVGIDLHSSNSVLVIADEKDKVVFERRLRNDLPRILAALAPYREQIDAVAVESTFNWYWLVDGLMEAGYAVKLVNTAAVKKYDGMKYTSDEHDARHLAHLLRLGILREKAKGTFHGSASCPRPVFFEYRLVAVVWCRMEIKIQHVFLVETQLARLSHERALKPCNVTRVEGV